MVSISNSWPMTESLSSYHALTFRKMWPTRQRCNMFETADFQIQFLTKFRNVFFFMWSQFSNYLKNIEYTSVLTTINLLSFYSRKKSDCIWFLFYLFQLLPYKALFQVIDVNVNENFWFCGFFFTRRATRSIWKVLTGTCQNKMKNL